jgi:hypothetical protein
MHTADSVPTPHIRSSVDAFEKERQATLRKVIAKSPGDDPVKAERRENALQQSIKDFSAGTLSENTVVIDSATLMRCGRGASNVRLDLTHRSVAAAECFAEEVPFFPVIGLPRGALALSDKLTEISFVGNSLFSLPAELASCSRLRRLCAGANSLTAIPDLSRLPLEHVGLAGNRIDDAGLPLLLAHLPACLFSLDISLNRLEILKKIGGVITALDKGCPALKHLCLGGNPLTICSSYPEDVLASPLGGRLTLLDDAEAEPARELALAAAAEAAASAAAARQVAAAMVADMQGVGGPGTKGAGVGEMAGAPREPEAERQTPTESVTLRFSFLELTGLPEAGSGLQNVSAHTTSDAATRPADSSTPASASGERLQVRMNLLDQGRSSASLTWGATLAIGETFDLTLPRTVALRDTLAVRGVAFEWTLLPTAPADSGAMKPVIAAPGGAAGDAAALDGKSVEAPPVVPPEGLALCTMLPTWRPLLYGKNTHSQRVSA